MSFWPPRWPWRREATESSSAQSHEASSAEPTTESSQESSTTSATDTSSEVHIEESRNIFDRMNLLFKHLLAANHWNSTFLTVTVILFSLLLAGCTSSPRSLRNIYILSLSYESSTTQTLVGDSGNISTIFQAATNNTAKLREVRVGYFGLCALTNSDSWLCGSRPHELLARLRDADQADPLNLLWIANRLRTQVISLAFIFMTIILAFVVLVCGLLLPLGSESSQTWLRLTIVPHFTSNYVLTASYLSVSFAIIAAGSALTAALWQHLAGATCSTLARDLSFGAVSCRTGTDALAMGWRILTGRFDSSPINTNSDSTNEEDPERQSDSDADPVMQEQQPLPRPDWQPQQAQPNIDLVRALLFFAGNQNYTRNNEWDFRQNNTAAWVERDSRVRPGYAETVEDEEAGR
ncbi:hypothetical protein S40288_10227 [Stachybotrys chartarum IBT 40288]|nr:hypothetical protein S40288_10227 [Stachybotrys chartarum IBT 40288]